MAAHGGTIEAESQGRGKGSRFTVRFPPDRLAHPSGTYVRPGTD
ncbi:HAMP domain-containing histidine kinase [Acidobacteria bacterium ACD]|nr:HAMP domain-containing histidine kinase [Acidobacteria bacterium ACD]